MLVYKPIKKQDIKDLVKLFNQQFIYDKITDKLLYEKIFMENSFLKEANFQVMENNRLVGFATGFIREYQGKMTGWIKLLAALDQKKSGPVITEIFRKIESVLIDNGAEIIRFFDSFPNYYRPGLDPRYTSLVTLLEGNGYKRRRDNVNMSVDLRENDFDTQKEEARLIREENITCKRADKNDKGKITELIEKDFPAWEREILEAYSQDIIPLHIALFKNEVIGFSAHNCNNVGTGWFGPMGTTPQARGKGIGEILLKRCLADMKEWGQKEATIAWVGPIGFYHQKVGAEVKQIFWNYEKEINL